MVKQRSSKVKQKLILLIVLIGIMGFIYYMSAQPVVRSGEMSFRIDRLVCRLFVDGFENMTAEQQQAAVYDMDFLVRKSAHFLEYTMLGLILMLTARTFLTSHQKTAALLTGAVYAALDEVHQYFVPGRACQVRDVLIDYSGIVTGILTALLLMRIIRAIRNQRGSSRRLHR